MIMYSLYSKKTRRNPSSRAASRLTPQQLGWISWLNRNKSSFVSGGKISKMAAWQGLTEEFDLYTHDEDENMTREGILASQALDSFLSTARVGKTKKIAVVDIEKKRRQDAEGEAARQKLADQMRRHSDEEMRRLEGVLGRKLNFNPGKTSRKRRVNRVVPSPSTPETRARAKERAAKSRVIGKLFSAGNAKMAMKLAKGQITIAQGRNAL